MTGDRSANIVEGCDPRPIYQHNVLQSFLHFAIKLYASILMTNGNICTRPTQNFPRHKKAVQFLPLKAEKKYGEINEIIRLKGASSVNMDAYGGLNHYHN